MSRTWTRLRRAATKSLLNSKNPGGDREPVIRPVGGVLIRRCRTIAAWQLRSRRQNTNNTPATDQGSDLQQGTPPKVVGHNKTGFSTMQFSNGSTNVYGGFKGLLATAVMAGVKGVRNTASLGAVIDSRWTRTPRRQRRPGFSRRASASAPVAGLAYGGRGTRHPGHKPRVPVRDQDRGHRRLQQRPGTAPALQQLRPLGVGVRPIHRQEQHESLRQPERLVARYQVLAVARAAAPGLHPVRCPSVGHE